ncbi:steroid (22S)-hydroxylase-like [Magnolia sinica]|uniref:steroid (22S)-hydroxylase-like n=1 Tax=Magnolia sinica TaxID=86752 RepID=UPI0026596D1B|nr:steroid (22S)-hydroxylase-like [Magnolia sinica]
MDFLDVLLTHNNTSEEEILSLVLDLLLGGYETTAMLISIIVKFLSGCPRALNELREEHEGVRRGKVGDGGLGWDDYKCMNFTQDLINEALRCGNVVKFVHRKAITPIQYKGFEIPVGWKVLPIFSGVHLDSSHYSDPQQFNPWRWQEEKMGEMGAGGKNFTPFGGGRRLCPGSDLAKLETAFFLHHLVLDFSWDPLIDDDQPISFPYLDFKHGLPISIHPFCQPH